MFCRLAYSPVKSKKNCNLEKLVPKSKAKNQCLLKEQVLYLLGITGGYYY